MVDVVMLLHGQFQPLQRVQPPAAPLLPPGVPGGAGALGPQRAGGHPQPDHRPAGIHPRELRLSAGAGRGRHHRTNLEFLQEHFSRIATHILRCADPTFGCRLLELCNQGLFECLALNLYCLGGERAALTAVINDRIRRLSADVNPSLRRLSADVNPSLVSWLTAMMGLRLQVVLEHMPVTEEQVLPYVRRLGEAPQLAPDEPMEVQVAEQPPEAVQRDSTASPAPATTAEEALARCRSRSRGSCRGSPRPTPSPGQRPCPRSGCPSSARTSRPSAVGSSSRP
ncbi:unnamed protein product [Eretmochelys imbricata]